MFLWIGSRTVKDFGNSPAPGGSARNRFRAIRNG
jgi:hypothetical protein